MRSQFVLLMPLAIAVLLPACGDQTNHSTSDVTAEARTYVERLRKATNVPGMAAAVAIDGEIVWAEGFGFADQEKQVPATPKTVFRIGSVSKVLTAAAVALLVERGQLDLDAPVQRYVPEFPEKDHVITTRQLTGHLAGIRHYNWGEERPTKQYEDVIDALAFFKEDPLTSPPGERFSYSSYGWVLVSAVIQRAAGQPFLDFMREQVFTPLGMHETQAERRGSIVKNRTVFYDDGKATDPTNVSYIWAAGGFSSTVEDLARFGSAFLPGSDFVGSETMRTLFTNQRTNSGDKILFGIGWMVDELTNGKSVYYHLGTLTGGHSALFVNPEDRIVVALLANQSSGFGLADCNEIACIIQGLDECPALVRETNRKIVKAQGVQGLTAALGEFETAVESQDVTAILALLAANFTSSFWKGPEDLRAGVASGEIGIDLEDLHLRSEGWGIGAVVRVENARLRRAQDDIRIVMDFVREESGWKISSIERD